MCRPSPTPSEDLEEERRVRKLLNELELEEMLHIEDRKQERGYEISSKRLRLLEIKQRRKEKQKETFLARERDEAVHPAELFVAGEESRTPTNAALTLSPQTAMQEDDVVRTSEDATEEPIQRLSRHLSSAQGLTLSKPGDVPGRARNPDRRDNGAVKYTHADARRFDFWADVGGSRGDDTANNAEASSEKDKESADHEPSSVGFQDSGFISFAYSKLSKRKGRLGDDSDREESNKAEASDRSWGIAPPQWDAPDSWCMKQTPSVENLDTKGDDERTAWGTNISKKDEEDVTSDEQRPITAVVTPNSFGMPLPRAKRSSSARRRSVGDDMRERSNQRGAGMVANDRRYATTAPVVRTEPELLRPAVTSYAEMWPPYIGFLEFDEDEPLPLAMDVGNLHQPAKIEVQDNKAISRSFSKLSKRKGPLGGAPDSWAVKQELPVTKSGKDGFEGAADDLGGLDEPEGAADDLGGLGDLGDLLAQYTTLTVDEIAGIGA